MFHYRCQDEHRLWVECSSEAPTNITEGCPEIENVSSRLEVSIAERLNVQLQAEIIARKKGRKRPHP